MTILHSCCCWRSVRKGSIASGIYTALYYTINAAHTSFCLHEDLTLLQSNMSMEVVQAAIINHETTSVTLTVITSLILATSSFGIFSSCLLLYGLHRDCKMLLIPWICNIIAFTALEVVYVVYSLVEHALIFNPAAAILITIDLFIISLNLYALLCVISQYQELKAGRGRALDDQNAPNIQYSAQPTATSYMSTRRAVTYQETRPTPTQSPCGPGPNLPEELSPNVNCKGPRKSVKFPDNSSLLQTQNGSQLLDPWTIDVKSPILLSKGNDTAPLIETVVEPAEKSSL